MKRNYLLSKHPQIFQPAQTCDACTILTKLIIYLVAQILSSMGRIAEWAFASPGSWSPGFGPITIPECNQEAINSVSSGININSSNTNARSGPSNRY